MSTLVAHLPPIAELLGEDGEPISMADLALAAAQSAGPMAVAGAAGIEGAMGSAAIYTPSLRDTDPAMLGAVDLQDSDLDADDFDADNLDHQPLVESEVANDVREFAEEGVTFAEAGVPESTGETTEWNLDSPLVQQQVDADGAPIVMQAVDSDDDTRQDDNFESEFGIQGGSQPRPLAEVTDLGMGREERAFVPRPRVKRQAAPLKSIIGIVVGGLMAFPMAAGILALAGKPLDLGFWPFDGDTIVMNSATPRGAAPPRDPSPRTANNDNRGGRSLADDLPSLDVDPPSLADSPGDLSGGFSDRPAADDLDNMLAADSSPGRNFADIALPSKIQLPPLDLSTPATTADEPEMTAEISDANPASANADPFGQPAPIPTTDPVTTEQPVVEEITAMPALPTNLEPVALEPRMTLPAVSAELQSALEEASAAMGGVVDYDDSEGVPGQRKRLATLFEKVAAVGSIATTDDEAAVGSLVQRLVDSELVSTLSPAAPNWARYSRRPNNGMLATGKLRRENDQWMLDWTGSAPLEVRFTDPSIAEEGASVIILGTIQQTDPAPIVEVTYLQKQ